MFRTIIVACDGGEHGRSAVRTAAILAEVTGAALHLVAAYPQQPLPFVECRALRARLREAGREHDDRPHAVRRARPRCVHDVRGGDRDDASSTGPSTSSRRRLLGRPAIRWACGLTG